MTHAKSVAVLGVGSGRVAGKHLPAGGSPGASAGECLASALGAALHVAPGMMQ